MSNRRSSGNPLLLPLLLVVVLAGALVAVMLSKKQETQAAAEEEEVVASPFDDLPEETPPERNAGRDVRTSSNKNAEAPDLEDNPYAQDEAFQDQLDKAAEAEALFQEAVAALEDSDRKTFQQKGYEARKLFEQVIEATAELEETLIAEHGDTDEEVRAIVRTRAFWEDRRLFLHEMAY